MTSTQLAAILKDIGGRVLDHQERISVSKMLEISQEVEPGIVGMCISMHLPPSSYITAVHLGGRLLEHFLTAHATYSIRRIWRSVLKSWTEHKAIISTVEDMITSVQAKFYFFVLRSLCGRGRQCTVQLFYITLLLNHKGLSRTGIHATRQMNLTLAPRTYDEELQRHLIRQDHLIRSL